MRFLPKEFLMLGKKEILQTPTTYTLDRDEQDFKGMFGVTPFATSVAWEMIALPVDKNAKPIHFLWTLMFLRRYDDETELSRLCSTSRNTFRKWTLDLLVALANCEQDVIIWERRFRNCNNNSWCKASVDGTDFQIYEPHPFSPNWYSHKYKAAGLRYEVCVSIGSGDIVWINGPFPCGSWPDLKIFRRGGLRDALPDGEMVEADNGYRGEPTKIRVKDDYETPTEKKEKERIRARHETVNRRFKQFNILQNRFRHDLKLHKHVFRAVAVLTQIEINCGNTLFSASQETERKQQY